MQPRKFSVLIAGFPYGGNGNTASEVPQIGEWLSQTLLKMKADERIHSAHYVHVSDTPITMTRNYVVRQALAGDADFLLMIDSDQVPDVELNEGDPLAKPFWESSFDFALEHYDKGPVIIGSPYCGPPIVEENVYVFRWTCRITDNQDSDYGLEPFSRAEAARRVGIEPVAALPTGLILIDLRVFQHIKPPYFYYEFKDEYQSEKASTEDVTFTRDVSLSIRRKLGYDPCFCNWDAWAGHWKPKCVRKPRITGNKDVAALMEKALMIPSSDEVMMRIRKEDFALPPPPVSTEKPRFHMKPSPDAMAKANAHRDSVTKAISHLIKPEDYVVDIGPGDYPFPRANHYVDWKNNAGAGNQYGTEVEFTECDISTERLPFEDKSIDFLVCRHVVEDLEDPAHFLAEVNRVAKAGYIETPSPSMEMTRMVDAAEKWKGYHHHHSFVWSAGGVLYVTNKFPSVEHMETPDSVVTRSVNTHHLWEGELHYKILRPHVDYNLRNEYRPMILTAIELGCQSEKEFLSKYVQ